MNKPAIVKSPTSPLWKHMRSALKIHICSDMSMAGWGNNRTRNARSNIMELWRTNLVVITWTSSWACLASRHESKTNIEKSKNICTPGSLSEAGTKNYDTIHIRPGGLSTILQNKISIMGLTKLSNHDEVANHIAWLALETETLHHSEMRSLVVHTYADPYGRNNKAKIEYRNNL